ncbi:MAG: putative acetyl-CoA acyltransferase [Acidimicrobiia bacterium]|nr:putative acetyl-CoA acyltransferase [Acidimicrobiia bacterium]
MPDVVIIDAVRSAVGKRHASLSTMNPVELLGDVITGLIERTGIDPSEVGHVIGGCVNQLGTQSGNVIRNAWLGAGLPLEVPAATIQTQCGSSHEAHTLSHGMVAGGLVDVAIACGIESMSRIPMGSAVPEEPNYGQPREGRYAEHYEPTIQFEAADRIAEHWGFSREELDVFGKQSQDRAIQAWNEGRFENQIITINAPVTDDAGNVIGTKPFNRDEGLRETTLENLAKLKPNQKERQPNPGLHTAGNSSQISDGSGAILMMTDTKAAELGLRPKARIVHSLLAGSDPVLMLTGPIPATQKLLAKTGLTIDDIDLFEVNEAFASVVLAWQKETGADLAKTNVNGGAIALGHPLGGTGAILITKALHELERIGGRYALITMCCGGGLGTGTIIERL